MDEQALREILKSRKMSQAQIDTAIAVAKRFEAYVSAPGRVPSDAAAWAFSKQLIAEGQNTRENYIALINYCRLLNNNEMFVAFMELVDGGEVGDNLYRKIGETFGVEIRDLVFEGIGVAPYGTPTPDKPAYMHTVLQRLQDRIGENASKEFLSPCLRSLPDSFYASEPAKFRQAGNIETYLVQRKAEFVAELEKCQRDGRLFFAQEITDAVLDFVRNDPEMGAGKRVGNIIYETKIPYMTSQYLAESDPVLRRYYACHCPWARDAIKNGNVKLVENLCYCSGGFHKKSWEAIYGQPLKIEVLESALKGDDRCRFAIHLPAEAA